MNQNDLAFRANEMLKCKNDPIYFIENYVKVNTGAGHNLVKLAPKQKDYIRMVHEQHNVLVLGSRQTGKTTFMIAYCAWAMLFFKSISIVFISRQERQAKEQLIDLEQLFENLPKWMRPTLYPNQATTKTVKETGSTMKLETVGNNPSAKGRGIRAHIIWIDEAAFLRGLDPLLVALYPTTAQRFLIAKEQGLPHGVILTTTPNGKVGVGRAFYKLWRRTEEAYKEYERTKDPSIIANIYFVPFKVHWTDIPLYDENWYLERKRQMGPDKIRQFHQEYDLLFIGSEDTFLSDEIIEKLKGVSPYKKQGDFWFFKPYDPNKKYIIATDVATKFGAANSAIEVIELDTGDQVAEYNGKLPIHMKEEFSLIDALLVAVREYPNSIVSFESNGVGNQLVEVIPEYEELNERIYKDNGKKLGINTSGTNRKVMFDLVFSMIYQDAELVKSRRLISELVSLEQDRKTGRIQKGDNATDDLVLALAQAYYIRNKLLTGVGTISNQGYTKEDIEDLRNTSFLLNNDSDMISLADEIGVDGVNQLKQLKEAEKRIQELYEHLNDSILN